MELYSIKRGVIKLGVCLMSGCFCILLCAPYRVVASTLDDVNLAVRQKNFQHAISMLMPIVETENTDAEYLLGSLYRSGTGVEKNHKLAYRWFLKAARSGHTKAQYAIGTFYEHGWGTARNVEKAIYWYKKGQENGSRQAGARLLLLQNDRPKLDKNQIIIRAFDALKNDNALQLKNYFAQGISPNIKNKQGSTLLSMAMILNADKCFDIILLEKADFINLNTLHESAVSIALKLGKDSYLQKILQIKPRLNQLDSNGNAPLHIAVKLGSIHSVRLLIEAGAELNVLDSNQLMPLDNALLGGKTDIATLLKQWGAQQGKFYKQRVAKKQNTGVTQEWLLKQKVALVDINSTFKTWPLLNIAAYLGKQAVLDEILSLGISPLIKDTEGVTAIDRAIQSGHLKIFQSLYSQLAFEEKNNALLNHLLEGLIEQRKSEIAVWLVQKNDIGNKKNSLKKSLLMDACLQSMPDVMAILLRKNNAVDRELKEKTLEAEFLCAAKYNFTEVIPYFVFNQKLASCLDSDDNTGLWYAAKQGNTQLTQALIRYGAKLEAIGSGGSSPLSIASQQGHVGVVKILLNKGAKIESSDASGLTPLIHGVLNEHVNVLQVLLTVGANTEQRDNSSRTALMYASEVGNLPIARLLVENGAHINRRDKNGLTAEILAGRSGFAKIAKFLREKL